VADECLWLRRWNDGTYCYVVNHVDDFTMVSSNPERREQVHKALVVSGLDIRDEGLPSMFVGLKFVYHDEYIGLSQEHYIEKCAEMFGCADGGAVYTPGRAEKSHWLSKDDLPTTPEAKRAAAALPFPALCGALLYACKTRPDVQFAVSELSQYMTAWGVRTYEQAKRVLRYLYHDKGRVLRFRRGKQEEKLSVLCYADSNYGDSRDSGNGDKWCSHGGYAVYVGGQLVSWRSKRQRCVTLSSMEAEYVEATHGAQEVLWWRRILEELGFKQTEPSILREDNKSCIAFALNNTQHDRSKHIDIRLHWLRGIVDDKHVELEHVSTEDMVADLFTKHLRQPKFEKFRDMLFSGLRQDDPPHFVCNGCNAVHVLCSSHM
jgi:hypothetical protein